MEFTQLDEATVESLTTAQTGFYREVLEAFKNSDVTAADVSSQLGGRKLASAAQSLKRQAAKTEFEGIDVIHRAANEKDGTAEVVVLVKR